MRRVACAVGEVWVSRVESSELAKVLPGSRLGPGWNRGPESK